MPTVDELLQKRKGQLEKMSAEPIAPPTLLPKKRIERTGPTRPWQENLPQYQNPIPRSSPIEVEESLVSEFGVREKLGQGADKPTTKLQQTPNEVTTLPTTKLQQTPNKATAYEETSGESQKETYNKLPTQLTTLPTTKLQQTPNEVTTTGSFLALVGLQRKIVLFIYELCRSQGTRITEAVSISNVAATCETTVRAAQETIRRLEMKAFIRRAGYKNGRGGWTNYELLEDVYKELFQLETYNKLTTKLQQTPNKLPTQPTTQLTTSAPSSSSFLDLENLKTTTTELEVNSSDTPALSPEWVSLDIEPLTTIGFTQNHLAQIARQNLLKPEVVQDSIYGFAFDLRVNGKGSGLKSGPLNFFMGILKKGIPYAPPENYVTPEQEALKKYLSAKKAQAAQRELLERELQEMEFQEWVRSLNASEKREIAPQAQEGGPLYLGQLRLHFEQAVWPVLRSQLPGFHSPKPEVHSPEKSG